MQREYQRDAFIEEIRIAAEKDPDIYFISADFGAPALDRFRSELSRQFLHAGISEQNMIDLAAGMALSGKKVYVYAMAPFITLRCLEQIKCSLAIMNLPVTVIAVGIGLGYADSGPTHYTTEDLACMRAIAGAEVYTPCDGESAREIARLTLRKPAFRILRLERWQVEPVYGGKFAGAVDAGYGGFGAGRIAIAACGYMTHRAFAIRQRLAQAGIDAAVYDVFRNKPLGAGLATALAAATHIATIEEQCLPAGFGSMILELLSDHGLSRPVRRFGLPETYFFDNGGREHLHGLAHLDADSIAGSVRDWAATDSG